MFCDKSSILYIGYFAVMQCVVLIWFVCHFSLMLCWSFVCSLLGNWRRKCWFIRRKIVSSMRLVVYMILLIKEMGMMWGKGEREGKI